LSVDTAVVGVPPGVHQRWFLDGLAAVMERRGYRSVPTTVADAGLIFNVISSPRPRPFRRRSKATFVIALAETNDQPDDVRKVAYPLLVRAIANFLIFLVGADEPRVYFITLEQGCYEIPRIYPDEVYFTRIFEDLLPIVTSTLFIDNDLVADLPESERLGDPVPEQIRAAGARLDRLGLLPSPFPLEGLLSAADRRHVSRLFGIGGMSYGNLSARAARGPGFWMTASGINKGQLGEAGRDILLVCGYDLDRRSVVLRVSPLIQPRHASVDAIEHALIYEQNPEVGAIVHVHSWIDGVPVTQINYPCGTYELGCAVAELIRQVPDPTRAIVGLKNHGLTITGPNLADILARIDGKLLPSVPPM
jgi:hypothetical protein